MEKILIVEDNRSTREMLDNIIAEKGYETVSVENVSDGLLMLKKENISLIISDLQLPDMDGIEFLKRVKSFDIPFIILTAYGSIEKAVLAIKNGAYDFITKPVEPEHLFLLIEKALNSTRILRENIILKEVLQSNYEVPVIIGNNNILKREAEKIKKVANTDTPVLLLGESGTGKELFARAIHFLSNRRDKPFIAINSASIPSNLLENELFGHEKGSYTDAYGKQIGKLELAQGGTFFLDEIGDLPISLQGKILRVIEEKKITRIGGEKEIELDIRFIFATNKNLEELIKKSEFRQDLYFRINVFPVTLPPLRERKDDIELLSDYFAKKLSLELKKKEISIDPEGLKKLRNYKWPGNVRELQNTIERAVIICEGNVIRKNDIILPEVPFDFEESFDFNGDLKQVVKRAVRIVEKIKIENTLKDFDFNKTKTAGYLNISYKNLLEKIKEYGIKED